MAKVRVELNNDIQKGLNGEQQARDKFELYINNKLNDVTDIVIELKGENAKALDGQSIKVKFKRNLTTAEEWYRESEDPYRPIIMVIPVVLRNGSNTQSGNVTAKLYTNTFDTGTKSTDIKE